MPEVEYAYVTTPEEFGQVVRAARKEQGMSQVQLAAACGCSQRFVSQLERGKATAELGKALQVAAAAGLRMHLDGGQQHVEARQLVEQGIAHIAETLQPKQKARPKLADYLGQAG